MHAIWMSIALTALLAIGACSMPLAPPPLPVPAAIAERTTIDERAALAVEVAYAAAGRALEAAVDSGRLRGDAARRADEIDAEAHHFVRMARAAYDASNADGYVEAAGHAAPLISELRKLAGAL